MEAFEASQRSEADREAQHAQAWPWGYAAYYDPSVDWTGRDTEEVLSRTGAMLLWARSAVGIGSTIGSLWQIQKLEWPLNTADVDRAARFSHLRKHFNSLRATDRIKEGVIHNTFLVFDSDTIQSVASNEHCVDAMFVWAVDPDYQPAEDGNLFPGYVKLRL
ncbi:hypothetical protein AC579_2627 [Pseudocercospora musae]|uniref:Uncharacterized protein n=1 Tax=Pseudocercospora musae TaxID=113226 RepID=A0A139IGQ2_9PEZI|nr:hypothetical protein AC579_2627 [Pseudocercospora musae]